MPVLPGMSMSAAGEQASAGGEHALCARGACTHALRRAAEGGGQRTHVHLSLAVVVKLLQGWTLSAHGEELEHPVCAIPHTSCKHARTHVHLYLYTHTHRHAHTHTHTASECLMRRVSFCVLWRTLAVLSVVSIEVKDAQFRV